MPALKFTSPPHIQRWSFCGILLATTSLLAADPEPARPVREVKTPPVANKTEPGKQSAASPAPQPPRRPPFFQRNRSFGFMNNNRPPVAPQPEPIKFSVDPQPVSSAATRVDELLQKELLQSADNLAPASDDATFLRRVSLDLTGELPSLKEINQFSADSNPNKRAEVVEKLLASEEYGRNWGRYWRDVIMYRRTEDRALLGAGSLEKYLTEQLNTNTGWHKITTELLTATGNVAEDGRNGLILAQQAETEETAAEVSRIFLGIQIQCAQCHDHPSDKWKRQQFHELAAFFPRIRLRPIIEDGKPRGFEVASLDRSFSFGGQNGQRRGDIEHYMSDLNDPTARGKQIQPKFFATGLTLPSGLTDSDRRQTLARWITSPDNPWFAQAFVNRMWAELVGEGFYEPVDDLGPERKASAPETIAFLGEQFAAHEYDIKWLLTAIISTDAYQRASRSRRDIDETPFTASCPQRLRADQLYDALVSALGIEDFMSRFTSRRPGGAAMMYGRMFSPRAMFAQTFGYDPSDPREEVTGSIPQALIMMNSTLVNGAINGRSSRTELGKLLSSSSDNKKVATDLYLRCLAREPSADEMQTCLDYVRSSRDRSEAFEDILWALVNSTEFLHRR